MISGIVTDGHSIISVSFRLPNGSDLSIEFVVVDTGFTDELCLPPETVALLNLPFKYDLPVNLANNSEVIVPVHKAVILWKGTRISRICYGKKTSCWNCASSRT